MTRSLIDGLLQEIEKARLADLVSDLIRIPSVNPKDEMDCKRWMVDPGEGALAQALERKLAQMDLEVALEEVAPGRPNLIVRYTRGIPGPTLVYNAHLDTVGAYDMQERAFRPEVHSGRLYGRGAADMKGALGCFVATLQVFAHLQIPLRGEIVLTAVIGEEGPPSGTDYLVRRGFRAEAVIVGEASECHLFLGQRGGQFVRIRTHGKTAHGSMPEAGINAIENMARLFTTIPGMKLFREKHPLYGYPTCTIGKIKGGVRTNVVPDHCEATLDIRLPPGVLPNDVLLAFQEQMDVMNIAGEVEPEEPGHPAYLTEPKALIVQAALAAIRTLHTPEEPSLAPYWSDMAYFSSAGIPSILLGPGSILQAHSGDEYVEIDQLKLAAKIYALTAILFCGLTQ